MLLYIGHCQFSASHLTNQVIEVAQIVLVAHNFIFHLETSSPFKNFICISPIICVEFSCPLSLYK